MERSGKVYVTLKLYNFFERSVFVSPPNTDLPDRKFVRFHKFKMRIRFILRFKRMYLMPENGQYNGNV
jgi:hypothetical protein